MTEPDPAGAGGEPLKLRTEWSPLMPRWDVILSTAGIAWQRNGTEVGHWVPWELVGGASNGIAGRSTPSVSILALDGSRFGSIEGLLQFEDESTSLSRAIVLVRPDLFVEVDGYPWTGGCIRREVNEAKNGRTEP